MSLFADRHHSEKHGCQASVLDYRPVPAADMAPTTESSAAEETASDASFSADEQPEERAAPYPQLRGAMPSSKDKLIC